MEKLFLCLFGSMLTLHCFMASLAMRITNSSTDESALLALKASLNLNADHVLSINWSSSFSFCNWIGVTCGIHHRRVRVLNLSHRGISGTIPPQLGNLSFLVELDLHNNSFHGQLPGDLLRLHRLKRLNLSYNGFSGEIPNGIGRLSMLQHLSFRNNTFSGSIPPSISNLSVLQTFDWNDNLISGSIPPEIGQLRRLKILRIAHNKLSGAIPPTISNISSLELLSLPGNSLSGNFLKEIGNLLQLRIIYLHHNQLSGNLPKEIGNLPLLREIDLNENQLSGSIPLTFFNNSMLEEIDLSYNRFWKGHIPRDIEHLTNLQLLYLENCNLEGNLPKEIGNLPLLREIYLDENQLSGSIPLTFFNNSGLEKIDLSDNRFWKGHIPRDIENLTNLQLLYLDNCNLEGFIPKEIGHLGKLEKLDLGFNQLTGSIPWNIFNISTLKYLHLGDNFLSGSLPSNLGCGLPNLEELHLQFNALIGNIPNSISNASKLIIIELAINKLRGVIPNTLGNLRELQKLRLYGNNFTVDASSPELNILTSLASCRHLIELDISNNPFRTKLPKSIGNLSNSMQYFRVDSCGFHGNIPLELGNLSNLYYLSLSQNYFDGSIPTTIKELQELQLLYLEDNMLQGSIVDELCEIKGLGLLNLGGNNLSGVIPICFRNLTSLRILYLYSNKMNFEIQHSSFWSLKDILKVDLSSNDLTGGLPIEIQDLKVIILLDLSSNHISGNIPTTIGSLQNLQNLSLAYNKLQGLIPDSIGQLIILQLLDLSQNNLFGEIPKSLESLQDLRYINFSYNRLEGEIPSGGPFIYFTAGSFMHNKALCGKSSLQVPPCLGKENRHSIRTNLILIKIIFPIILLAILVTVCIVVLLSKNKSVANQHERDLPSLELTRRISFYEVVEATNRFDESNLLGKGGFGTVYKGILSSGMKIAIKVFNLELEVASRSFDIECDALCNLRHRNLTKIISCCANVDFKCLIMEFMPNRSVDEWLHCHEYFLDFLQRLNIMIDVASALEYLHYNSSTPVVHCDLKPSNVLLDKDMVAHVSDFGIAKILAEGQSRTHTSTLATTGYIAPEYGSEGIVSVKGDVYSYGIMLMEMFTRKKPTDEMFEDGSSLKSWVSESMPHAMIHVVDSTLLQLEGQQIDNIMAHASSILNLALNCCENLPESRINMLDVVASLKNVRIRFMQNARAM